MIEVTQYEQKGGLSNDRGPLYATCSCSCYCDCTCGPSPASTPLSTVPESVRSPAASGGSGCSSCGC
jgi:hypothetical protein